MSVQIRRMRAEDLAPARRVYREAFAAFTQLSEDQLGESDVVGHRYNRDPGSAFVAEREGEILGACVNLLRGSISILGPVMVAPGAPLNLGARLISASDELLTGRGARLSLGFTFGYSVGHLEFVARFGFQPQTFNAIHRWPVPPAAVTPGRALRYSQLEEADRRAALEGCDALTSELFGGWSVRADVEAVRAQGLGETLLLAESSRIDGFAVCHHGPGSEANAPGQLAVRLAAVRRDADVALFELLLAQVEAYAAGLRLRYVLTGLPTVRRRAYRALLARRGSELVECGVGFQRGDPTFGEQDHLILDDWR